MSPHTEFQLHIMFQTLDIHPTITNIKTCTTQKCMPTSMIKSRRPHHAKVF